LVKDSVPNRRRVKGIRKFWGKDGPAEKAFRVVAMGGGERWRLPHGRAPDDRTHPRKF